MCGLPCCHRSPGACRSHKQNGCLTGLQNKAKERNSFFQSLRRTRTAGAAPAERPSSSSSLSPASSLDAPSLSASGRAETGDAPGLASLSQVVQGQLAGVHAAQNGYVPSRAGSSTCHQDMSSAANGDGHQKRYYELQHKAGDRNRGLVLQHQSAWLRKGRTTTSYRPA